MSRILKNSILITMVLFSLTAESANLLEQLSSEAQSDLSRTPLLFSPVTKFSWKDGILDGGPVHFLMIDKGDGDPKPVSPFRYHNFNVEEKEAFHNFVLDANPASFWLKGTNDPDYTHSFFEEVVPHNQYITGSDLDFLDSMAQVIFEVKRKEQFPYENKGCPVLDTFPPLSKMEFFGNQKVIASCRPGEITDEMKERAAKFFKELNRRRRAKGLQVDRDNQFGTF